MHRFYLPPPECQTATLTLAGREAHHALHVLRVRRGDQVSVLDGQGHEFACAVEHCSRDALSLAVTAKNFTAPPPCRITLLQAIPRGRIIESIIQKAVELGITRVVPLLTERVAVRFDEKSAGEKREKWRQVAIEAIKQCGAAWLPKIESPVTLEQFMARQEPFELSLAGSLQPERRHPKEVIAHSRQACGRNPESVGVWIGPEGDFTPEELSAIQTAGAVPITLGRLTLRVETAAIYCLSILNYEFNSRLEHRP